ncbi:transposase family protein [Streptomyces hydrogenans]|uniref:transposase family protein n=1 Tax=Streptomyces hydrogenans TaxID=1873719 RepID=UPI00332954E7
MVPYRATVDVPHELVEPVSWLIYAQRCERGSRWRKLGCFRQALLALVHPRKNEPLPSLAAGFGVSTAAAWRYVSETLDVLAAWTSGLYEALTGLGEGDHVIVDSRPDPHRPHRRRRAVLLHETSQAWDERAGHPYSDCTPLRFSRATPGRTHDLTAARTHRIIQTCERQGIPVLADRAYQGAGPWVTTGLKRPPGGELTLTQRPANRTLAAARAPVERGMARLKSWQIFRRSRISPNRMTVITKTVLTLERQR